MRGSLILFVGDSNAPSRCYEFARAVVKHRINNPNSPIRYVGFVRMHEGPGDTLGDITKALRSEVYNHWDGSPHAPAKARPRDDGEGAATSAPKLQILAWQDDRPVWPDILSSRFAEGTSEHGVLADRHKAFLEKYPQESRAAPTSSDGPRRAGGTCDFTEGAPLDWGRDIDLASVKESDFTVTRCPGKEKDDCPWPLQTLYTVVFNPWA